MNGGDKMQTFLACIEADKPHPPPPPIAIPPKILVLDFSHLTNISKELYMTKYARSGVSIGAGFPVLLSVGCLEIQV
jgi:hypothetical protein